MRTMTDCDPLTGLENESGFLARAESLRRTGHILALVSLDIDHFEYLSTQCGADVVDRLLTSTAQVLAQSAGSCARLGGDRFALVLDGGDARRRMEMILDRLSRTVTLESGRCVQFSAGLYLLHDREGESVRSALSKAALAAKTVKQSCAPRKLAVYDGEMAAWYQRQVDMELYLGQSIRRRELKLYLQPQVYMDTGRRFGAEALVRWESPVLGLVMPDQFLPLAERSGFVVELDFYMLEEACRLLRRWSDEGREVFPISVNQSRAHLLTDDYIQRVLELVDRYRVKPEWLVLELTESAFCQRQERLVQFSEGLHRRGFGLSIDDFGTGDSTLSLLKYVRVDQLKLDRSLVQSSGDPARDDMMLRMVLDLARGLGVDALCEGVETQAQARHLTELGYRMAQGYLYGRPAAAETLPPPLRAAAGQM